MLAWTRGLASTYARTPHAYASWIMCLCKLKKMCMHEEILHMHESCIRAHGYKLHMQADTRIHMSTSREMFYDIFRHISIKTHPTENPSIYISKKKLKLKIKANLKNEKSLKNLPIRSLHSPRDDHVAYRSMKGTLSNS